MKSISRPSDMNPHNTLHLQNSEEKISLRIESEDNSPFGASVEFCAAGGGTCSANTLLALRKLFENGDKKDEFHSQYVGTQNEIMNLFLERDGDIVVGIPNKEGEIEFSHQKLDTTTKQLLKNLFKAMQQDEKHNSQSEEKNG